MSRAPVFASLRHRNARLFFGGLLVSNVGTWIQSTAMAILVYRLTGKAVDVGITVACQFLPMLLLGATAGSIADRHNKRRMTAVTQTALAAQALVLGLLELGGFINLAAVYVMSLVLGLVSAFDNPARRSLIVELVDHDEIVNAMSLNTATTTGSRIIGPAIAGVLVNAIGAGWCFVINGISFGLVLISLWLMHADDLRPSPRAAPGGTPIRDAVRFVFRDDPALKTTFVVLAIVSTFGFTYTVSFPKLAAVRLGDDSYYGLLLSTMSIGNLIGSLLTAARRTVTMRWFLGTTALFGSAGIAVAWSPNVALAAALVVPFGLGGAGFITSANSIAQERCPPEMRGRVLSLSAVAFLGSTPIGAPITGVVADQIGVEWGVAYGSVISLLTAIAAALLLVRSPIPTAAPSATVPAE